MRDVPPASHMVVFPPPMASTEEWLSDDAPRQYVHLEKRAALVKERYRMLEILYDEGNQTSCNIKWRRPDGTTVTTRGGGVAALLKDTDKSACVKSENATK